MKMKEIASLCKKSKHIYVYNVPDADGEVTQWISDGSAIYPLRGMSYLDKKTIMQVFDIPDDKQSDYIFRNEEELPEGINFSDIDELEIEAERFGFPLILSGKLIQPLTVADSIAFFNLKYMAPVNTGGWDPFIFERLTEKGVSYFVLKVGMLIVGIVFGYDGITKYVVNHLEDLAAKVREAFEEKKRKDENFDLVVVPDEDEDQDDPVPKQPEACPEGRIITIWELFGDKYKSSVCPLPEDPEQLQIDDIEPECDQEPEVPEDEIN